MIVQARSVPGLMVKPPRLYLNSLIAFLSGGRRRGAGLACGNTAAAEKHFGLGRFPRSKVAGQRFSRYRKALEQRNKALKNDKISQADVAPWDQILAESGQAIVEARQAYLGQLNESFKVWLRE